MPCRTHLKSGKKADCNRIRTISYTALLWAYPRPVRLPVLIRDCPDPHAILTPPSGEGGRGFARVMNVTEPQMCLGDESEL